MYIPFFHHTTKEMKGLLLIVIIIVVILLLFLLGVWLYFALTSVAPAPVVPKDIPVQESQLRVMNSTGEDIVIVATCGPCGTPFPGLSSINISLSNGKYYDFDIPDEGLVGARIFAKTGCDSQGNNCIIGDSLPNYTGPPCPVIKGCTGECTGGPCGSTPCQPPLNSLVEFTFGCTTSNVENNNCNIDTDTTSFDTSNVDGFTFPFTLEVLNPINCTRSPNIDASKIDLTQCPSSIDLSYDGVNTITVNGEIVDLTDVDLRYYNKGILVGCYSPCQVLTSKYQLPAGVTSATQYCCPTPPVSSQQCQFYPAANNLYTQAVRGMVSNSYTFAYDDMNSLSSCQSGVVKYLMTFLPLT